MKFHRHVNIKGFILTFPFHELSALDRPEISMAVVTCLRKYNS